MESSSFGRSTINDVDLAKYERLGDEWWDLKGPMGALHKFNPVRVDWITDLLTEGAPRPAHSGRHPSNDRGLAEDRRLAGKRILDIGSGGGILSESLARRGAAVVGIDPAPNNIAVATRHAAAAGIDVDYRCTTIETLATGSERFDAVLVMEVVEHVRDVQGFLRDAASVVAPGGLMIGATLNRTMKSYALAIVGAEYVLRWLPRGTHDWRQFVTPAEFKAHLARAGLANCHEAGVTYNPLRDTWHLARDMGCNYMVAARRPAA